MLMQAVHSFIMVVSSKYSTVRNPVYHGDDRREMHSGNRGEPRNGRLTGLDAGARKDAPPRMYPLMYDI
jgi:hypothetical protein